MPLESRIICAVYQTGLLSGPYTKNVAKTKESACTKFTPQPGSAGFHHKSVRYADALGAMNAPAKPTTTAAMRSR